MSLLNPDNLVISQQKKTVTKGITLPAGDYERGAPIGLSGGAYGKIDGTTITTAMFDCILCEDVSSTEEITIAAYFEGEFRASELVMEDGVSSDDLVDYGRDKGIYIK